MKPFKEYMKSLENKPKKKKVMKRFPYLKSNIPKNSI